ncbi:MAG: hypothetical protein AMS24_03635 [Chlamydiae bacterium SM23_39]|nr:MAG: hypothetical protein AMS24_03635 [Chlamydiae bacterium SM23_39]
MAQKKMKLCTHCDGMVDIDVIICPYCGNDVSEIGDENKINKETLYSPPYKPEIEKKEEEKKEEKKFNFIPFILFSLGINILLFGFFLFLFSNKGELFLKWKATYWFVYVLIGLPLIFIGNKLLSSKTK